MKRITLVLTACLLIILSSTARTPSSAQEMERVVAVVNDDVITMTDLDQRVRVSLLSAGLPDSPENRQRIAPQVLRRLIDEHIQLQEAKAAKISVREGEIEDGVAMIERQNHMQPGALENLLKSRGIGTEAIHQQIRAELSWVKVVRAELLPNIHIGEEEIDNRLGILKANKGKPEYLAAEIMLPVDSSKNDAEVMTMAERLIDQMRHGTPFSALARQFSATGAASGGDLGWVSEGMMDSALFARLTTLHVGEVTPPIREADGYHILLLRQKRVAGEGEGGEPVVDMAAIDLFPPPESTPAEHTRRVTALKAAIKDAKSCDDYEAALRKVPLAEWLRPGPMIVSQLPTDMQPVAARLQVNQATEPLEQQNRTRVLIMCSRTDPRPDGLPSRDEIKRRIEDERAELMAQHFLRDLRRAAFVEIRI